MSFHSVSPTRTYVAICHGANFKGVYFKKFTIPNDVTNDGDHASWYFLNNLDFQACVAGCISFEDYSNITPVEEYGKNSA